MWRGENWKVDKIITVIFLTASLHWIKNMHLHVLLFKGSLLHLCIQSVILHKAYLYMTIYCIWQFNDQKHDYPPPLLYVNLTTLSQNGWCHSSDGSSFPLRRPKFNPRPLHVQCAVELVAPWQFFSKYIWFSLTVIIPWILHTFRSLSGCSVQGLGIVGCLVTIPSASLEDKFKEPPIQ